MQIGYPSVSVQYERPHSNLTAQHLILEVYTIALLPIKKEVKQRKNQFTEKLNQLTN